MSVPAPLLPRLEHTLITVANGSPDVAELLLFRATLGQGEDEVAIEVVTEVTEIVSEEDYFFKPPILAV